MLIPDPQISVIVLICTQAYCEWITIPCALTGNLSFSLGHTQHIFSGFKLVFLLSSV